MQLRFYFSCLLLFIITICTSGCNNILEPTDNSKAEDKVEGSYTWWNSRVDGEQMDNADDTQFGDQPSFDNDEQDGGDQQG